jgi:methylated-DNA-[protein]-cysteine S-methyltransferase
MQTACAIDSPVGPLTLAVDDAGRLTRLAFGSHAAPITAAAPAALRTVAAQLAEYFAGRRKTFECEVAPHGTPFQRQVWAELQRIPYGSTISYAQLARRVGNPAAFRAVGSANGANPIAIVIPCHRVIASDGSLGGFGGGLPTKDKLLQLEGVLMLG